ncbi:MAG: hypothetical protein WDO24_14720 [Pseudomonadota bacterium]
MADLTLPMNDAKAALVSFTRVKPSGGIALSAASHGEPAGNEKTADSAQI